MPRTRDDGWGWDTREKEDRPSRDLVVEPSGAGRPFADRPNIELPGLGSFSPDTPTRELVDKWREFRFGGAERAAGTTERSLGGAERERDSHHYPLTRTQPPAPPPQPQQPQQQWVLNELIRRALENLRGGGEGSGGAPGGSEASDIDELRSPPWTTEFEQAAIARADELVRERYNALREQRARELAARGILPGSGLWEREMGRIDREAAREMANFRRDLLLKSIDVRQQRLAQARAIEAMMESMERQRLFDLLAILSGNPNYAAAAGQLVASLAPLLGQQAAMFGGAASQAFGNLGDLFAMLLARGAQQPPQVNV